MDDQNQNVFVEDAKRFFDNPINRQKYPRLVSVLDYWKTQCKGAFAPDKIDFSLSELPLEVIPYCMMVDVFPDGPEFVYRFWGTKYVEITKQEMTGKNVTDMEPKSVADENYKSYCVAFAKKAPLLIENTNAKSFLMKTQDLFLRVPLTNNGTDCEFIVTVFEQPTEKWNEVERKFEEAVKNSSSNENKI